MKKHLKYPKPKINSLQITEAGGIWRDGEGVRLPDSPMTTTGTQTVKNLTASGDTPPMASWRYMKPTSVLMAMSTTLVGVATFSDTRNSSVRTEKVQMSIPLSVEASKQARKEPIVGGRAGGRDG